MAYGSLAVLDGVRRAIEEGDGSHDIYNVRRGSESSTGRVAGGAEPAPP